VRNLRTVRTVYWVNISESSGAGSLGLFPIKHHQTVAVVVVSPIITVATGIKSGQEQKCIAVVRGAI